MSPIWIKRSGHMRRLSKTGRIIYVKATYVELKQRNDKMAYRRRCPHCGAKIISVAMPNGGWGHFENGHGLTRVKHACFNLGEGLSQARDQEMRDLFEDPNEQKPS